MWLVKVVGGSVVAVGGWWLVYVIGMVGGSVVVVGG